MILWIDLCILNNIVRIIYWIKIPGNKFNGVSLISFTLVYIHNSIYISINEYQPKGMVFFSLSVGLSSSSFKRKLACSSLLLSFLIWDNAALSTPPRPPHVEHAPSDTSVHDAEIWTRWKWVYVCVWVSDRGNRWWGSARD